jgi:hypothetical protein
MFRGFAAMMTSKSLLTALTVLSASLVFACASQSAHPPEQIARPSNRYIYVTQQGLPGECYTNLGPVKLTESYGEAAVDPDLSEAAKRLRAVARATYPGDVDAVINVNSQQNDIGTQVTVSGDAIRLENHTTMHCALRESKGVMDTAAMIGAGGIGGAVGGGLASGAGLAATAGLAGASAAGAKQALEQQAAAEQQQEEFRKTLGEQRREITRLLRERAQLRKCREQEIKLDDCLNLISHNQQPASVNSDDEGNRDATDATPFQMQKHLQEQQEYIKQLKSEIAQIRWQMGGY